MLSSASICLLVLQEYTKTTQPMFTTFGGNVVYGPWKKLVDFLVIGIHCVRVGLGLQLGGPRRTPQHWVLCLAFVSLSFNSHFPGEPGLASVY